MRVPTLFGLFLLASASTARAQDCSTAADQAAMTECAGKAYEATDAELNTLYKQIEARLSDDAETKGQLVTAQKAWIAFRDAECGFSTSTVSGGSIYPMIYAMCLDTLTQARITDLKGYLDCQEGDTSCPVPAE